MTFTDCYFYLVLAAPYAFITFSVIWLSMRWKSNWKLDPGTMHLVGAGSASIVGTATLIIFINGLVSMSFSDLFWNHEILPTNTIGVMVYAVSAVAVSLLVCLLMKANFKPTSSITA